MSDWTVISDGSIDVDSPWNTDRATEYREDMEYLFERMIRVGLHATGVRLALARGTETVTNASWSAEGDSFTAGQGGTVTFSSEATDGDPNFSAAPTVWFGLEQHTSSLDWGANGITAQAYVVTGGLSATQLNWEVTAWSRSGTGSFYATLHWFALGPVTSGE